MSFSDANEMGVDERVLGPEELDSPEEYPYAIAMTRKPRAAVVCAFDRITLFDVGYSGGGQSYAGGGGYGGT